MGGGAGGGAGGVGEGGGVARAAGRGGGVGPGPPARRPMRDLRCTSPWFPQSTEHDVPPSGRARNTVSTMGRHPRDPRQLLTRRRDPIKDREWRKYLGGGEARIEFRRSSQHPTTYCITLQVRKGQRWETLRSFDNSHPREGVDLHHMHRYADGQKLSAEPLPCGRVFDTRAAIPKIERWIADNWEDLIDDYFSAAA